MIFLSLTENNFDSNENILKIEGPFSLWFY